MMREMTGKGLGCDRHRRCTTTSVLGIFTDGDLRRLHRARRRPARADAPRDVMHPRPRTSAPTSLAVEAADLMEQHRITSVLVVDADGLLVGALNTNDLMRAKVI